MEHGDIDDDCDYAVQDIADSDDDLDGDYNDDYPNDYDDDVYDDYKVTTEGRWGAAVSYALHVFNTCALNDCTPYSHQHTHQDAHHDHDHQVFHTCKHTGILLIIMIHWH